MRAPAKGRKLLFRRAAGRWRRPGRGVDSDAGCGVRAGQHPLHLSGRIGRLAVARLAHDAQQPLVAEAQDRHAEAGDLDAVSLGPATRQVASARRSNPPATSTSAGESPGTTASSASDADASFGGVPARDLGRGGQGRGACHSTVSPVTCRTTARPFCSSKASRSAPGSGLAGGKAQVGQVQLLGECGPRGAREHRQQLVAFRAVLRDEAAGLGGDQRPGGLVDAKQRFLHSGRRRCSYRSLQRPKRTRKTVSPAAMRPPVTTRALIPKDLLVGGSSGGAGGPAHLACVSGSRVGMAQRLHGCRRRSRTPPSKGQLAALPTELGPSPARRCRGAGWGGSGAGRPAPQAPRRARRSDGLQRHQQRAREVLDAPRRRGRARRPPEVVLERERSRGSPQR